MSLIDEIHAHRDEILALAKKCGVKDVRVFGSVARGEEDENSDIDILLEYDSQSGNYFGFIHFQEAIQNMFNRKVDIAFESGLYHLIKDDVLADAEPV